eukprot:GHVL01006744.1.p1 GENE.GHVL01006744.1~~GHVL01006744.1.p1  ORF type:complete len:168 (+),score=13.66 GHVL01006744.1:796-1299(+)
MKIWDEKLSLSSIPAFEVIFIAICGLFDVVWLGLCTILVVRQSVLAITNFTTLEIILKPSYLLNRVSSYQNICWPCNDLTVKRALRNFISFWTLDDRYDKEDFPTIEDTVNTRTQQQSMRTPLTLNFPPHGDHSTNVEMSGVREKPLRIGPQLSKQSNSSDTSTYRE